MLVLAYYQYIGSYILMVKLSLNAQKCIDSDCIKRYGEIRSSRKFNIFRLEIGTYIVFFYCMTCYCGKVSILTNLPPLSILNDKHKCCILLQWIKQIDKATTSSRLTGVHLRFALPKMPAKVVVKLAIVSSPSTS